MIKTLLFLTSLLASTLVHGQDMKKTMEKRGKEFIAAIATSDKAKWEQFIKDNYTKELMERPMKSSVQKSEGDRPAGTSSGATIQEKSKMFEMLHDDLGEAKILSMKSTGENLDMKVEGKSGMAATFQLTFKKSPPYLIDGIKIEAGR